jgi:Ni,Fe-hydrogenase III large subunit
VCTVTHQLAFCQAVEQLCGLETPLRARWARVVLAELERLYNHVGDLGNICAGIGFHPGTSRIGALKERLLGINEAVAGHRYLMGSVVPGGVAGDPLSSAGTDALAGLREVGRELADAVRAALRSDGVRGRLQGTGTVTAELAVALGATGVAAKASGLTADLRHDHPYAAYGELSVNPVTASSGDVAARFTVRAQEAQQSIRLIAEALERAPAGESLAPGPTPDPEPGASVVATAEGPRGASHLWLRAGAGGTVDRVRLRSGSYADWPVVASAVPGDLVPDFPLINKSFELCYACTDR